jgi:hypothetical protein
MKDKKVSSLLSLVHASYRDVKSLFERLRVNMIYFDVPPGVCTPGIKGKPGGRREYLQLVIDDIMAIQQELDVFRERCVVLYKESAADKSLL